MLVSLILDLPPEKLAELRQAKKIGTEELDDVLKAIMVAAANNPADRQTIIDNLGALL